MIFGLAYMILIFGVMMTGMIGLLSIQEQFLIPDFLRYILFFVGFIMCFVSLFMIHGRAMKTGVNHLLEFGKPSRIIWFYVHKDGSIKITPAVRDVEGQLYSKELDAQINEMKSYRLFDHSIRFVPEGIGHAVDLGMCLYAQLLKNKWGFGSLREARDNRKFYESKTKTVLSQEYCGEEQ